jgi:hypothetical protein
MHAVSSSRTRWLGCIAPGGHRRIEGLRLVTAYAIAAMLGTMADILRGLPDGAVLSSLSGGFRCGLVCQKAAQRVSSQLGTFYCSARPLLWVRRALSFWLHFFYILAVAGLS